MPELKERYIAIFLRHSQVYFQNGTQVDVLLEGNNPHQRQVGDLETIFFWKQDGEEVHLIPVEGE